MKNYLRLFAVLAIISIAFTSCESEAEKAFKAAKAENKLSALHDFWGAYKNEADDELRNEFNEAMGLLIKDSICFSNFTTASGRPAKYGAAKDYLKEYPEGSYAAEASAYIEENEEAMKKFKDGLNKYASLFKRYDYTINLPEVVIYEDKIFWNPETGKTRKEKVTSYTYAKKIKSPKARLSFSEPDEYGRGTITGFSITNPKEGYGQVDLMVGEFDPGSDYREPHMWEGVKGRSYYYLPHFSYTGRYEIDEIFNLDVFLDGKLESAELLISSYFETTGLWVSDTQKNRELAAKKAVRQLGDRSYKMSFALDGYNTNIGFEGSIQNGGFEYLYPVLK